MDSPTLFGMVGGEAGPEGIIPLDPFWSRLDSAVSAAVENFGGVSRARQDAVALSPIGDPVVSPSLKAVLPAVPAVVSEF